MSRLFIFLAALAFLQNCSPSKKTAKKMEPFDWQGHRGCRGLMPENTIPAFAKALEFDEIKTLELDVVISQDRKVVVSHEPWMNPEIMSSPYDIDFTLEESLEWPFWTKMSLELIQKYWLGRKPHPRFAEQTMEQSFKPTLEQAVTAMRQRYPTRIVFWNIEIKSEPKGYGIFTPEPAEFAQIVLEEVRNLGIENASTIQSFDPEVLRQVKKIGTVSRLALLVENENGLKSNLKSLGFQPDIYSPYHLFVDQKLVAACHKRGIKIIPWTVNEVPRMKELLTLKVDGIITDYPNRIADALN